MCQNQPDPFGCNNDIAPTTNRHSDGHQSIAHTALEIEQSDSDLRAFFTLEIFTSKFSKEKFSVRKDPKNATYCETVTAGSHISPFCGRLPDKPWPAGQNFVSFSF